MNGTYTTTSATETQALGRRLAHTLQPGSVIALKGDLGCGKTCITQAIAEALGVLVRVTSPTFALMNQYEGTMWPLYHFDLYRLADNADYMDLDFDEYLYGNGICLIEWAEKCTDLLPDNHIEIIFTITGDASRTISISGIPT